MFLLVLIETGINTQISITIIIKHASNPKCRFTIISKNNELGLVENNTWPKYTHIYGSEIDCNACIICIYVVCTIAIQRMVMLQFFKTHIPYVQHTSKIVCLHTHTRARDTADTQTWMLSHSIADYFVSIIKILTLK